jgi:hypothetical protein
MPETDYSQYQDPTSMPGYQERYNTAPAPATEKPPAPDGWPGWKWSAGNNAWSDAHDTAGHQAWLQQQQVQSTASQYTAPTLADVQAQGGGAAAFTRDPKIDPTQLDPARAARDAALEDQRSTLKFALGLEGPQAITPEERQALEQRFSERATLAANSVAMNARGGAGAQAAARLGVNQQMPAIAGEANLAATQAANQDYQARIQAFNARVGQAQTAGGIANTIGQTSTAAFGQEAQVAESGAQIDLGKLGIDVQNQSLVNNMIQHVNELGIDYAKLDISVQEKILDDMTQRYGIDKQAATQLKIAAQQAKKGPLDYLATVAKIGTDVVGAAGGLGLLTKPAAAVIGGV